MMAEKCISCGKTGVPLVGLGGSGFGPTRKRCIPCFTVAMKRAREERERVLEVLDAED